MVLAVCTEKDTANVRLIGNNWMRETEDAVLCLSFRAGVYIPDVKHSLPSWNTHVVAVTDAALYLLNSEDLSLILREPLPLITSLTQYLDETHGAHVGYDGGFFLRLHTLTHGPLFLHLPKQSLGTDKVIEHSYPENREQCAAKKILDESIITPGLLYTTLYTFAGAMRFEVVSLCIATEAHSLLKLALKVMNEQDEVSPFKPLFSTSGSMKNEFGSPLYNVQRKARSCTSLYSGNSPNIPCLTQDLHIDLSHLVTPRSYTQSEQSVWIAPADLMEEDFCSSKQSENHNPEPAAYIHHQGSFQAIPSASVDIKTSFVPGYLTRSASSGMLKWVRNDHSQSNYASDADAIQT